MLLLSGCFEGPTELGPTTTSTLPSNTESFQLLIKSDKHQECVGSPPTQAFPQSDSFI